MRQIRLNREGMNTPLYLVVLSYNDMLHFNLLRLSIHLFHLSPTQADAEARIRHAADVAEKQRLARLVANAHVFKQQVMVARHEKLAVDKAAWDKEMVRCVVSGKAMKNDQGRREEKVSLMKLIL